MEGQYIINIEYYKIKAFLIEHKTYCFNIYPDIMYSSELITMDSLNMIFLYLDFILRQGQSTSIANIIYIPLLFHHILIQRCFVNFVLNVRTRPDCMQTSFDMFVAKLMPALFIANCFVPSVVSGLHCEAQTFWLDIILECKDMLAAFRGALILTY